MTLFELMAVAFIVGLVSLTAVMRYGTNTVADMDGRGFARRIALDCSQARRRAIATGDNHFLRFTLSGSSATQYALYRRIGASTSIMDDVHTVPSAVTVTTGGVTDVEFTFTGDALASYTITVQTPDRTWTVTVPQVTGKAIVQ
jgi:hypothetical protein